MRFAYFAIFSFILTACVTKVPQFSVPEWVTFEGKTFEKVTHNQIDEMQQLLYLPMDSAKNTESWTKGILLFLDKNSNNVTLLQRAEIRKQAYEKQKYTLATVEIKGQELQSQVIYPPTERFNDVQLEVTRGREELCGYSQMQYADKRSNFAKELPDLTAYQSEISKLAEKFNRLAWLVRCNN